MLMPVQPFCLSRKAKPPINRSVKLVLSLAIAISLAQAGQPTFYHDVLPVLERHCQSCHRPGEIGPMPLLTYQQARPWARAIKEAVKTRAMPPWFAEPEPLKFINDPSLSAHEIAAVSEWADDAAPKGIPDSSHVPRHWAGNWNIQQPSEIVEMPVPVSIPASGDVEYTYEIVPTGFKQDTWVRMAEIRPSARDHVHHAVVYVRPPSSRWLRSAPTGVSFTSSTLTDPVARRDAMWTDSDILLVYAPGSSPDIWRPDMAKLIPAGSDLVFQIHYTTNGKPAIDQTRIGLVTSTEAPDKRVLTLQLTNDRFVIPPGVDNYRVEARGSIPNDALLLSFFPHMHLRGKRFEYNIVRPSGSVDSLLKVDYNFYWQLSYRLTDPLPLKAGTILQAVAWFDNSKANLHNPDPESAVRWGDQTYDEMMVGFFDVAVPRNVNKFQFFQRPR
jgi:hypothetical protein